MEDHPKNSSVISKQCSLRAGADQESGWTAYLEDFALTQNSRSINDHSFSSPSLISDAAWNGISSNQAIGRSSFDSHLPGRLNFNNTSNKFSCDDDLEDTASSPVNSPKAGSLRPRNVNYMKRSDQSTPIDEREDRNKFDHHDGRKNDEFIVEQKKRAFCLVPVAVLMNHLR